MTSLKEFFLTQFTLASHFAGLEMYVEGEINIFVKACF